MKDFLKQLVVRYLFFWARLVLSERKPRIVGITGSVGKTTTKEAIAQLLMDQAAQPLLGVVAKSGGNLNTELGLPLAMLRWEKSPSGWLSWLGCLLIVPCRALWLISIARYPAVLVLEYAADRPGDISRLADLAQPEVAVVTAVGPAHLERFKTVERVAKEKAALVRHVPPTGLVVLARDNHWVSAMEDETHASVVKVRGKGQGLALAMAEAVGRYFGLDRSTIQAALKKFRPPKGRLEIKDLGQIVLLDDTYNANPLSMELALETLAHGRQRHLRRVAFLGEMKELGTKAPELHRRVGRLARKQADVVVGVGELAKEYQGQFWYPTSRSTAEAAAQIIQAGDLILVKGSRSVRMEEVVAALVQQAPKLRFAKTKKERHGKR